MDLEISTKLLKLLDGCCYFLMGPRWLFLFLEGF